jgi:hypothetical protein
MADTDAKVRCSAWAREVGLSPIGTIGTYSGYLLVETPLPWPRDVAEIPGLRRAAERVGPLDLRLQALVPERPDPADRRVILHARPEGHLFSGYSRYEAPLELSVDAALDRLLEAARSSGSALSSDGLDVLICTHGRRDVCCGSQGTTLATEIVAAGPPTGINMWRTSHTGGHRFAPTFVVLPHGTAWAFADVDLVARVLDRSIPFRDVAGHYRGCAGLGGPEGQTLEREVLTGVGWELLDRPRRAFPTGEMTVDGGQITRLEAGSDRWEGVVRPGRRLPVPECMSPLSDARKSETEWTASDVRPVR